jgi:hypothetical protein
VKNLAQLSEELPQGGIGTTTDGVRLEVRGCDLWTFRDGLVTRKDSFWKIVEPAAERR